MQKDDKITLALPDGSVRTGTITWENTKKDCSKNPNVIEVKKRIGDKFTNRTGKTWAQGYICALHDLSDPTYLQPISVLEWNYLYDFINGDAE